MERLRKDVNLIDSKDKLRQEITKLSLAIDTAKQAIWNATKIIGS
jgi:hypothetical protein